MGRPERYTPAFLDDLADKLVEYAKIDETPFLKHFCAINEVPSQKISELAKKSDRFCEALNTFKDHAEAKLVRGALTKKISEWFAFQTLKNVAGWREKVDIEQELGEKTLEAFERMNVEELQKRAHELTGRRSAN